MSVNQEKRLRVFAGPNGSGKSTVIDYIRQIKVGDRKIDFGVYINADDLTRALIRNGISLSTYSVEISRKRIIEYAIESGLLIGSLTLSVFKKCFTISRHQVLILKDKSLAERFAQILALILREELLIKGKKLSIETVFSHAGKVDFMRKARESGYKVYLYFVATESPEINKYRVKLRVQRGGHNVPEDKIEDRYYRSLRLMEPALKECYRAYFFDNSVTTDRIQDGYFVQAHISSNGIEWSKHVSKLPSWFTRNIGKSFE